MKIALCFSGQPRFIEQAAENVFDNVIGDYDVDVFAHLWFDEDLQTKPYKYGGAGGWKDQRIPADAIETFKRIYKPKDILVQKSKKFLDSGLSDNYLATQQRYKQGSINNPDEPNFEVRDVNNIISYYYSLMQVCSLKKEYEYANNFKYDYVIKMRTDSIVHNAIEYEGFRKDAIFFSGMQNQPDGMINDWFDFGGSEVMDVFMSAFPFLDYCIRDCMKQTNGAWCCESIHRTIIDRFEIPCQPLPIHITLPRF